MVQQCIDYGDTYHIRTEWDEWDDLVQKGYEAEVTGDENEMIACWWKAWDIFQKIVEQEEMKTRSGPVTAWKINCLIPSI